MAQKCAYIDPFSPLLFQVRLQRVTLLALHQYLGLGVELLTPTSRSGTSNLQPFAMKRQESQKQQDLERLLKKQLSTPEAENEELFHSLLFSSTIIQAKSEIPDMSHEKLRSLSFEAFKEVLNLNDDQVGESDMKEYININEPDEGNTLVREDSNDCPSLMLVLSGSLTVEISTYFFNTISCTYDII